MQVYKNNFQYDNGIYEGIVSYNYGVAFIWLVKALGIEKCWAKLIT